MGLWTEMDLGQSVLRSLKSLWSVLGLLIRETRCRTWWTQWMRTSQGRLSSRSSCPSSRTRTAMKRWDRSTSSSKTWPADSLPAMTCRSTCWSRNWEEPTWWMRLWAATPRRRSSERRSSATSASKSRLRSSRTNSKAEAVPERTDWGECWLDLTCDEINCNRYGSLLN